MQYGKVIRMLMIAPMWVAGYSAHAQERPVRVIVAFPAGGSADIAARVVIKSMLPGAVIDNRPGGMGSVAVQLTYDAVPNGKTILWGNGSLVPMGMWSREFPVSSMKVFAPIGMTAQLSYGMFMPASLPVNSVREAATYLRGRTEHYASVILAHDAAAVLFTQATGVKLTRVGYKGQVQLLADLAGGEVAVHFGATFGMLGMVREGRVKMLAVLSKERVPTLKDVPTMREAGYPSVTLQSWYALFTKAGVRTPMIDEYGAALAKTLADPEVKDRLIGGGLIPGYEPPAAVTRQISEDEQLWKALMPQITKLGGVN